MKQVIHKIVKGKTGKLRCKCNPNIKITKLNSTKTGKVTCKNCRR